MKTHMNLIHVKVNNPLPPLGPSPLASLSGSPVNQLLVIIIILYYISQPNNYIFMYLLLLFFLKYFYSYYFTYFFILIIYFIFILIIFLKLKFHQVNYADESCVEPVFVTINSGSCQSATDSTCDLGYNTFCGYIF